VSIEAASSSAHATQAQREGAFLVCLVPLIVLWSIPGTTIGALAGVASGSLGSAPAAPWG